MEISIGYLPCRNHADTARQHIEMLLKDQSGKIIMGIEERHSALQRKFLQLNSRKILAELFVILNYEVSVLHDNTC